MNKKLLVSGIVVALVLVGGVSLVLHKSSSAMASAVPVVTDTVQTVQTPTARVPAVQSTSSVPLMQSTAQLFSQYKYTSKAHEVFPTLATGTKAALGAFGYSKTSLGGGAYRFTLTNNAEGYKGQSVVVGAGQTLYFIEPSQGDDSASEDSITTDDFFVVVDAQGHILK